MTGLLQDLLHERADEVGTPHLDLDAITSDGDRRVRRRRTALLGGIAAATVAAGLAVPALLPAQDARRTDDLVADGTSAAPVPLSWTTGSVLHRPGLPDVDLGVDVRAWVWVGDDVVFTDPARTVRLWTGDALDVIGRTAAAATDDAELVSDGRFAAWVSQDGRVVRYDVAQREPVVAPELPGDGTRVTAMDGSQVYAADSAGVYVWQPTAPDAYRTVSDDPQDVVLDAEDGTTVQLEGDRQARVSGPGRDTSLVVDGFANLAPGGGHVVAESDDEGILLDTATGDRVPLLTGYEWALPFQWLDDDTVAVLAFAGIESGGSQTPYVLPCTVSTGDCGQATELPDAFQLPLGMHLDN